MILVIANWITILANLLILLIIVDSILSFFLSPYHPVRHALDRILEPLLAPIRRVVPLVGMLDLSPLILLILVVIVSNALVSYLNTIAR